GIATHGFALNVENDLEPFSWIVPCGLAGVRMTSVAAELGAPSIASWSSPAAAQADCDGPMRARLRERLAHHLAKRLNREPVTASAVHLGIDLKPVPATSAALAA
ncbi:MAG: hypothetical protein ACYDA6_11050, partial [Solirubrobacteraceae bacterium]